MPEVAFTIRLTTDDWDPATRAWRCPAADIPTAFLKQAFGPKGGELAIALFEIAKGPARVRWKGDGVPALVTLSIQLGEELSPVSEERRWKKIAVIAPVVSAIVVALIGIAANGWKPSPSPSAYELQLRVDPNDIEAAGLPPAKILVNNRELRQPIIYSMKSDTMAIVDVSKAIEAAKDYKNSYQTQLGSVQRTLAEFGGLFQTLDQLNAAVNGNLCYGGSSGTPADSRGHLSALTVGVSDKLRSVQSDLQRSVK